jgi:hypothetical protein
VAVYAAVRILTAWMLRSIVGAPDLPVSFVRPEPFSNACIFVLSLIAGR